MRIGIIQGQKINERGLRRLHSDPKYSSSANPPTTGLSAFIPVNPRQSFVPAPSGSSRLLKERPFFEDIKTIARGFGEIIEFPKPRICNYNDHAHVPVGYTSAADFGHSERSRLAQNLTKAAAGRGWAKRGRRRQDRRGESNQTASSNSIDLKEHSVESSERKLDVCGIPNETNEVIADDIIRKLSEDLKLPQALDATKLYSKSFDVLDAHSDILYPNSLTRSAGEHCISEASFPRIVSEEEENSSSESSRFSLEEYEEVMSNRDMGGDGGRAERVKKYKEERRKQQALQNQERISARTSRIQTRSRAAAASAAEALPPENGPTEVKTTKETKPGSGSKSRTEAKSAVASKCSTDQTTRGSKSPTGAKSPTVPAVIRTTRTSRLRAAAVSGAEVEPLTTTRRVRRGGSSSSSVTSPVTAVSNSACESGEGVMVKSTESEMSVTGASVLSSLGVSVTCRDDSATVSLCDRPAGNARSIRSSDRTTARQASSSPQKCTAAKTLRQSPSSSTTGGRQRVKDETSARRGHLTTIGPGIKAGSDSPVDHPTSKSASANTVNRISATSSVNRNPLSSPRSSSQSPRSPSQSSLSSPRTTKNQPKHRTAENNSTVSPRITPNLSYKNSLIQSHHKAINDASSNLRSRNNEIVVNSGETKTRISDNGTDSCNSSKETTGDTELSRMNKRLNPSISDDRRYIGDSKQDRPTKPSETARLASKMTPGTERNVSQTYSSPLDNTVDKSLCNKSSVDNRFSRIDKSRSTNSRLSSRMDALAALTKETLARVDRLTKKTQDSQVNCESSPAKVTDASRDISDIKDHNYDVSCNPVDLLNGAEPFQQANVPSTSKRFYDRLNNDVVTRHSENVDRKDSDSDQKQRNHSRNPNEPAFSLLSYTPVSILKRKSSQEDHGLSTCSGGAVSTPPVTFSPSVVDPRPSKSRQGQGILKKRRSLDESQVNRHRSCSPEVAFADDYSLDTRPILKSQRRSSLEEIIRGRSPDGQIQGILKRKSSRDGELLSEDRSLGSPEPQGILKRKSNSSSSSSTTSSHISIAQAVILAAAGGAELVDDKDAVRPILKKKSFSEERPSIDNSNTDAPRPILKKKSLTESDDNDHDRPKKPILKSSRKISLEDGNASSFDMSEDDRGSRRSSMLKHRTPEGSECESSVRPILKQRGSSHSREHSQSPRPRLSFCSDDERAPCPEDSGQIVQHFINPSFALLRRLEENNARQSTEEDSPRPSRFETGRLQSPSKLKEFMDGENAFQNQIHFPNVVRRRDLRPRIPGRSHSLASNFSEELDQILKFRRTYVDETCSDDNAATSSRDESPDKPAGGDASAIPRFPSIAQRIQSMEKQLVSGSSGLGEKRAQGAVPKKQTRPGGRYKTQPVTIDELQNVARLDVSQTSFHQPAGHSGTSSFSPAEPSAEPNIANGFPDNTRHEAEANFLSPESAGSSVNSKFHSYAASPGYYSTENPLSRSFDFSAYSRERQRLFSDSEPLNSPKTFNRVIPSAGSPEYRPQLTDSEEKSPDQQRSSDTSEASNFVTPLSPEPNNAASNVPCRRSLDLLPPTTPESLGTNLRNVSRLSEDRLENALFDDSKDSNTTTEFNRIFSEVIKRNSSNFDSLDFSSLDWDHRTPNLTIQQVSPLSTVDPSSNVPTNCDGQSGSSLRDDVRSPPWVRAERPNSLFGSGHRQERSNITDRRNSIEELERLQAELEGVRSSLDAETTVLSAAQEADHWSLNVSVDSGVFNRMSSGDSGPLSEELSLPQDFTKHSDSKDSQPSSIQIDDLISPSAASEIVPKEKSPDLSSSRRQPEGASATTSKMEESTQMDVDKEGSLEAADSPEQLFGLMKSNSVSARASMWQQMQQQANKATVKPILRHSRSKAKDGTPLVMERFKTQPITMDEVNDVTIEKPPVELSQSSSSYNLSLDHDDEAKLDENDPAKLTLAEKMKLFGTTINQRPPMASKKPRSPRFMTMPVLASHVDDAKQMNRQNAASNSCEFDIVSPKSKMIRLSLPTKQELNFGEDSNGQKGDTSCKKDLVCHDSKTADKEKKEIGKSFRLAQEKLAEQASRMLTMEVKGILKSRSGAIPLLPSSAAREAAQPMARSVDSIKKDCFPMVADKKLGQSDGTVKENGKMLLSKGESSEGLKDEGIDSSSDDESDTRSSHSSDETCSSSDSSDESDTEQNKEKSPTPTPTLVKPSQLKSSRTDSDLARVLKDNVKSERGVKLPCMDEMKARQIMERCMAKKDKENAASKQMSRVPIVQQPKRQTPEKAAPVVHPTDLNIVKLKNLKNGNFAIGSQQQQPKFPPSAQNQNDSTKNGNDGGDSKIPPFARKFCQPVGKSQSMMFHSQLKNSLRSNREDRFAGNGDGGSGSDGDSSGGREVRRIINKRRSYRGVPVAAQQPGAPPPAEAPQEVGGARLFRSATQPMAAQAMPQQRGGSIAERLAALQQSGNNDWRKRIETRRLSPEEEVTNVITATKNKINETLTQQVEEKRRASQVDPNDVPGDQLISDRRNKLETSAQDWKKRVNNHDAKMFSVAGRMGKDPALSTNLALSPLSPALATVAQDKKTPQPNRFRSRRAEGNGMLPGGIMKSISSAAVSQPASPKKPGIGDFKRSISVSGVDDMATEGDQEDNEAMSKSENGTVNGSGHAGPSVPVPRADDETFTSFFTSASQTVVTSPSSSFIPYNNNNNDINQIVEDIDLDAIDSGSRQMLSGGGVKRVRAARRLGGSRNPLRVLAARTDLRQEYTEPPTTGVADKETARMKRDKIALNAPMAVEALAGLASREDFAAIQLKSSTGGSGNGSPPRGQGPPPLLVQVKGRRRVQVRLVEPSATSVNSGDCFVLVTPDQVFCYNGRYANVIERSRAADIALHVHTKKDLGCVNSTSVITLDEQMKHRSPKQWKQFWSLLGVDSNMEEYTPTPAGNADEDEIFESGIISTNMCYEVVDEELVPIQKYWGQTPKIAMLDPSKILVFDFGSELYVWNGKNTILENRRRAFQLAQELWDEGFDYKDCHINPINVSHVLGARSEFKDVPKSDTKRPEWSKITKVTQHMETILFKDKFLDWPDFSRVIKVKEEDDSFKGAAEIKPCNVDVMWNRDYEDPSLVLEGSHIGRGTHYYDRETMRHFEVKTKSVTKWMIQEYDYIKIEPEDLNEFYSGDSYIIRWEYQITVTGRELNGKPSKHNLTGRDRCAYFCWQGKDASANEKGAAALLTVELDHEKGPQVRVTQNCEPPAFLNLFNGSLVIHQGKKGVEKTRYKVYTVRGNVENESHLVQVACSMRQLRSRTSMLVVDSEKGQIYVWHGVKSLKHTRSIALEAAKKMAHRKHPDTFTSNLADVKVSEIKEGEEPKAVIDILGGANRELYNCLLNKDNKAAEDDSAAVTPRLFHFTDLSGQFDAIEILSPLRHENLITSYPFSQQELYSASQPGLFLLDSGDRLWLWQGWWPQQEFSESIETASGTLRWQMCRRAAMETVLDYWKVSRPNSATPCAAYLAVAGLEPLPFTNLFDHWQDRDDIAELNIAYGYSMGEGDVSVSVELCRLSRTSFPLAVLRQRPLPDAVDPAHIEKYLSPEDFQETFSMSREEFNELPAWKQANTKKDLGLF